ncbi:MAG TPA: GNAT family N-acetyltransferase [Beutenbergiaceae bacterium]|nr:GNAT family N-acetyltransferase [Beutenbergiaceae bacterium]
MNLTIERVRTPASLERVHALRWRVFVEEQGVLPEEELDGLDGPERAVHLVAVSGGRDVGTARMLIDADQPGTVHATRVAVLAEARGSGVGRALMVELERIALAEFADGGQVRVELSAQESAIPFYAALGYQIGTERYLDARIWHRDAVKVLASPTAGSPR